MSTFNPEARPGMLNNILTEYRGYHLNEVKFDPIGSSTTYGASSTIDFELPTSQNINLNSFTVYGTMTMNTAASYVNPIEYFIDTQVIRTAQDDIETITNYGDLYSVLFPLTCTSQHLQNKSITGMAQMTKQYKIEMPSYHDPDVAAADTAFRAAAAHGTFIILHTAFTNNIIAQILALTGINVRAENGIEPGANATAALTDAAISAATVIAVNKLIAQIRANFPALCVSTKLQNTVDNVVGNEYAIFSPTATLVAATGMAYLEHAHTYLINKLNDLISPYYSHDVIVPQHIEIGGSKDFVIGSHLGLLGSLSVPIINTSFTSPIQLSYILKPNSVLSSATATYALSGLYATIQTISYPSYVNMLTEEYMSGGLVYAFTTYNNMSQNVSTAGEINYTHPITANSLKNLMITTRATAYTTPGYTQNAPVTNYYLNQRSAIKHIQLESEDLRYPASYSQDVAKYGYWHLLKAQNVNNNNIYDGLINSKAAFDNHFFCHISAFGFPDPSDISSFSGINTYGKSRNFRYTLRSDGKTAISDCRIFTFAEIKAKLTIRSPDRRIIVEKY